MESAKAELFKIKVAVAAMGFSVFVSSFLGYAFWSGPWPLKIFAAMFFALAIVSLLLMLKVLFIDTQEQEKRLRAENGLCLDCGYNLTGNVSGKCPECGTPVASD